MSKNTLLLEGESASEQAAQLLGQGECVALPTETVYGLAARADDKNAIAKIYEAKSRPKNHPLILHIAQQSDVTLWAREVPEDFYRLSSKFWPGALTLVLKKNLSIPDEISLGQDTVALRMPAHPLFLETLKKLGTAVVAPSANPHKELSPVSARQVWKGLNGRIAAVLDGGRCALGLESTILDLTRDLPTILRAGPITRTELENFLGKKIVQPSKHTTKIAGNMKAHYQPKAKLHVLTRKSLPTLFLSQDSSEVLFLLYSNEAIEAYTKTPLLQSHCWAMPGDAKAYGHELYHKLAMADELQVKTIIVEAPPQGEEWLAVIDRLQRAQG